MTDTSVGLTAPVKTLKHSLAILLDRRLTPRDRAEKATTYLVYVLWTDMGLVPPSVEELAEAYA